MGGLRGRRLLLGLLWTTVGLAAIVLGAGWAFLRTPPGRALVARALTDAVNRQLNGSVSLGSIGGSFWTGVVLTDVTVRGADSAVIAHLPRVEAGYRLLDFLGGRVVLRRLALTSPRVTVARDSAGRLNLAELIPRDTSPPAPAEGPPPLIVFYDVTVTDGHVTIALDSGAPRAVDTLDVAIDELRLSSPTEPGMGASLRHVALVVSQPSLALHDLRGLVHLVGDSVGVELARFAFGQSRGSASGAVRWPGGTLSAAFDLDLESLAPGDIAFLSDVIPARGALEGRARVALEGRRVHVDLQDFRYDDGPGRVEGRLAFATGGGVPVALPAVNLVTRDMDLALVEPLLDTMPISGRLSGRTLARGTLDTLVVDLDWALRDAGTDGEPVTFLAARGVVRLGGPAGLVFDSLDVQSASVALATVRSLARGFPLDGRLGAFGRLTGPWKNAEFRGTLEHRDGDRPASVAQGRVRLDTHTEEIGLDADVAVDPLHLDGLRGTYPALPVTGAYVGRLTASGTLGALALDLDLGVAHGRLHGGGTVGVTDSTLSVTDLDLTLEELDPAVVREGLPPGSVSLLARGAIVMPDSGPPHGELNLVAGRSRLAGTVVDTLGLAARSRDGLMHVERFEARLAGIRLAGEGSIPSRGGVGSGRLTLRAVADSLASLDSLARWAFHVAPDTAGAGVQGPAANGSEPPNVPADSTVPALRGAAALTLVASGTWDSLALAVEGSVRDLVWLDVSVLAARGRLDWVPGAADPLRADVTIDSLAFGRWGAGGAEVHLAGTREAFDWGGRTRFGMGGAAVGGGHAVVGADTTVVTVDSLAMLLPSGVWEMTHPTRMVATDSALAFDRFELEPLLGEGLVVMEGRLPRRGLADWRVELRGVPLENLYDLAQRDTVGIGGTLAATLHIGGTARAPVIRGSVELVEGRFRGFRPPLLAGDVSYAERRLEAHLGLWPDARRQGEQVFAIDADLPVDLALAGAVQRKLPGALSVRARAEDVDMAVLEVLTTNLERVAGTLTADVGVTGTWEAPRLTGRATIRNGAASLPALNVRHEDVFGELAFRGDSIVVDRMAVASGEGTLTIEGVVRLLALNRPRMELRLIARRFRALDVPDFLSLTASGEMQVTGPFIGAAATGEVTIDEGTIYVRDILEKELVNLSAAEAREFVSLEELRRLGLDRPLQSRMLDSLRVRDLTVHMGSNVRLLSSEANVQLSGRLQVDKERGRYRLDGTLEAVRGTYTLDLRLAERDFTVTGGTVRYFGTPDLNAALDITAQHVVTTVPTEDAPEQITIYAHMSGTLMQPRVVLSSDVRPPLSQTEIISYLLFARPSVQLAATGRANQQFALQQVAGLLSGELERTLVADLRIPLDYLEIRPGDLSSGLSVARAGVQIGRKSFILVSASWCPVGQGWVAPGAAFQYRFSQQFRAELSAEPVNQCRQGGATGVDQQLGVDLFWERSY